MRILDGFCGLIDRINGKIGGILGYLAIPLTFAIFFEVVARYVFNSPTIWAYDFSIYLVGIMVMLGGGYALLEEAHVAVDVFVEHIPPTARRLIDLILDLILLFTIGVLVWKGWSQGWHSMKVNEHYTSLWAPPIYPLKMTIPVGAFLLFLQGLAKFIRDFRSIINGITRH